MTAMATAAAAAGCARARSRVRAIIIFRACEAFRIAVRCQRVDPQGWRRTFNSPRAGDSCWPNSVREAIANLLAGVAELVDAHDSKSCSQKECRFDSDHRHQPSPRRGFGWQAHRPVFAACFLFSSPSSGKVRATRGGGVGVSTRVGPTRPRSAIASARPPSPKTGRDDVARTAQNRFDFQIAHSANAPLPLFFVFSGPGVARIPFPSPLNEGMERGEAPGSGRGSLNGPCEGPFDRTHGEFPVTRGRRLGGARGH
jgi:hypothetical protein